MIEIDLLNDILEYKNGDLYWKKSSRSCWVGKKAGTLCNGYIEIRINKKHYYAHRLIFLMHNKYLPKFIDHKDGNTLNNKIENLRDATRSDNSANSKRKITNSSGYKGVYFRSDTNKWQAALTKNYKKISLGSYKTALEAHNAYVEASKKYFGDFAKHE